VDRTSWHLWGAAAGALGLVANVVTDDQASLTEEERRSGAAVVDLLDRTGYHVGVVAGILCVFCLVLLAAGWRRRTIGETDAAALAVPVALTVGASALLVGYGFKGALAEYLPGGINDDNFSADGLYALFVINDTAPWFGWLGVIFAAALYAWLSLRRRVVPLWIGIVSAIAVLPPLGVMLATGAVAIAGVVAPAWLLVASLGLAVGGRRGAGGPATTEGRGVLRRD
jgi:hypothetical protein